MNRIEGPHLDDSGFVSTESKVDLFGMSINLIQTGPPEGVFEEFGKWWRAAIIADQAVLLRFQNLMNQITFLAFSDKRTDENRAPFHDEQPNGDYTVKPIVSEIGSMLDRMGGLGMMQYAYYCLQNHPAFLPGDSRSLEYAWDGIGEWRS